MTKKEKILASIIASGFIAIITALFCWRETFVLTAAINDQKLTNYFLVISIALTVASLFFLNKQIFESQRTRLAGSQPDLYFELTNYIVHDIHNQNFQNAENLPIVRILRNDEKQPKMHSNHLYVNNIGLGAAKEVRIRWIFNEREVRELIEGVYFGDDYVNETDYIDFISANTQSAIGPPLLYIQCCGRQLNNDLLDDPEHVKPNLAIELIYKDIFQTEYTKHFNVHVSTFMEFVTFSFREQ